MKVDGFLKDHMEEIREFEDAGVLEIHAGRDGFEIEFTDDGDELMKMMVGLNTDMQLWLFMLLWNDHYNHIEEGHKRLLKIAEDMTEIAEINILRTLEANIDMIDGLDLKDGHIPEEVVRQFDPDQE